MASKSQEYKTAPGAAHAHSKGGVQRSRGRADDGGDLNSRFKRKTRDGFSSILGSMICAVASKVPAGR